MNDFTKEELEELIASRCYHLGDNFLLYEDELFMKLQSMINNYCEHEKSHANYDYEVEQCDKCGAAFI